MNATSFKAGGALTDEHTAMYIERQADRAALTHLRAMDYLLVVEPRQQGKTSLINHLMCHPALVDLASAYVDVTTLDRSSEETWYQILCLRILRQLHGLIPRKQWPAIPKTSADWREFLCDVAMFATDAHLRVVIALDEIGAVTFPGATKFFSVLRDVYNSRQAEPELKQLTFLLSGAFHPRDLIKDDRISPFNIAQRVRLADFTLTQVRELVDRGNWTDEDAQATALAARIHYWTDGQPYLTQLLCSYLGSDAAPADVDAGVERLRREDENHWPPMLARLIGDEKLCKYVTRILGGEHIKFYPRENRRQAQLELLGVVKAGAQGFCTIRNQVYLQALARLASSLSQVPQILLDFTSTQSLIEQEWQLYGSQAETVQLTLEYDDSLRKLVLVKKGHGFDAAARYKHPNYPPLGWRYQYYELLIRISPESVVCVNVLDKTDENRTLLYSLDIFPGYNKWDEFQVSLDKEITDGNWHSLLLALPEHMEDAQWPGFEMVNWISLRGEVSLAGIRGCDDEDLLVASAVASPQVVQSSSTVTWLHLSDFHVGKDKYGQRRLFTSILDHVQQRIEAGVGPDMIFITGDIANKGKSSEYEDFLTNFFDPLTEQVSSKCRERIFVVPGNHDVDRTKVRAVQTYGVLHRIPQFLDPIDEGLGERRLLLDRFQAYVHSDQTKEDDPHWLFSPQGAQVHILDINRKKIGILGLNTAWLSCSDDDRHKLSAGKEIIETGLGRLRSCDLRIVLGHHPIDWFLDNEINPVRALFGKYNVVYLHGHLHKGHVRHEEGAGYPFLTLQSGACFQAREHERWVNRLLWCELDLQARELRMEPLHWSRDHQEWVIDGGAFPGRYKQPGTDRWIFTLPSS